MEIKITEEEKKQKELEDELYRQLGTMERVDLIDLVISYMNEEQIKEFVNNWEDY